jgi:hypothetical protein
MILFRTSTDEGKYAYVSGQFRSLQLIERADGPGLSVLPDTLPLLSRDFCLRLAYLALCPLLMGVALAQPVAPALGIETIIARMAYTREQNRARMRAYKVTRNYRLFAKGKDQAKSEVTVQVTFVPPGTRAYKVISATGMGLGEKIVREMLDGETQIVKQSESNDIAPENYRFELLPAQEENGRRLYVLELFPKRLDKHLLHAKIWVDPATFRLHRMSGEPATTPSWWLRDPRITFFYAEVSGMWLQVGSESTVDVRLFGEYKMISHDVAYEVETTSTVSH